MKPTTALFLGLIFGLPLVQAGVELSRDGRIQALDVFGPINEARLRKFDDDLREASLVHTEVTPWMQLAYSKVLDRGNEKAVFGEEGWLHLAADLESISAPSYLESTNRPVEAIVDFHNQLKERGVELIVLPTPEKTAVMPQTLSASIESKQAPHPDTERLFSELEAAGVNLIDLFEFYRTLPEPLYMQRDSHWTPATMERVAAETARRIRELVDVPATHEWRTETRAFHGAGDLRGMLRYPGGRDPFLLMPVECHAVLDAKTGEPCVSMEDAPVVVLGDSFTRVYSDAKLGLEEHAGFAEHLAKELSSTVDVIAIAGGASRQVRESLARRKSGVTGKKVVVWQFAMRDLPVRSNRWEPVELGEVTQAPVESGRFEVSVEVTEVTRIENFAYPFGLGIFEYKVLEVHGGESKDETIWVAHVIVDDFKATEAASFNVGDRHRLVLEPIEEHYDLESTSWADDTDSGFDIWFPIERLE